MHDKNEIIPKLLQLIEGGHTETVAAERAGIDFTTLWRWKNDVPGFAIQVEEAKRARIALLEDALYSAGLKGNVSAALAWLEKNDKGWRNRAKDIAPQQQVFVFEGGAAALISLLPPEKRNKLLTSLVTNGLLPENIIDISADNKLTGGTNGNGNHG